MNKITRRDFIKASIATGVATLLPFNRVLGANNDVHVAVVGLRQRGSNLIKLFSVIPGVRVVAICDADSDILNRAVKKFTEYNVKVDAYTDLRRVMDNKDIDAVVTATPNHWHALVTIWACQAGKDVYVEKPVCHNIWEGRKMVEAARKYKRIVQAGTQSRSDEGLREAFEYIQAENLGKILVARGFCYNPRMSIGRVHGPQPIPQSIDYNLWTGPAPLTPLMRRQLHYDWHWVWSTGNGDIGNQGIHEVDMCRWVLGQTKLAPNVASIGGRFGYFDNGQTPNTQIAIYDYKPAPLIFEVRGLPQNRQARLEGKTREVWEGRMDFYRGVRIGVVIQCEDGYFAGGSGGGWIYDNEGKKIKQFVGDGGIGHQANFIKAVRSRKVTDLNADILEGYISSSLCHMANISYRLGTASGPEKIKEAIREDKASIESFESFQDHLFANEVNLEETSVILGPWLKMDTKTEKFVGDFPTFWANQLLKRSYREPFVVPVKV